MTRKEYIYQQNLKEIISHLLLEQKQIFKEELNSYTYNKDKSINNCIDEIKTIKMLKILIRICEKLDNQV